MPAHRCRLRLLCLVGRTGAGIMPFSCLARACCLTLRLPTCCSAIVCRKHAALGLVGQLAREYNTNGPDWWDRLDDLWPALSKYVHKFQRLKKRYSSPGDVRRHQASRPMTLMHGDLHPANALVTRKGGQAPSDGELQVAIFDWAEINVSSGAEELAHFLLRSRFYEDVSTSAGGRQKQCVSLLSRC